MVTSGCGPRTAWHGYTLMVWSNNSRDCTWTSCGRRTRPTQESPQCFSYPTGSLRARTASLQTELAKNPARASFVAVRVPHGLFVGFLRSLHPYGIHKLIMQALKLYGPRTGEAKFVRRRTAPVNGRMVFVQSSPWTARKQHVQGLGVLCDWGIILQYQYNRCWWPGDVRSQDIKYHAIDINITEFSDFDTRRVTLYGFDGNNYWCNRINTDKCTA